MWLQLGSRRRNEKLRPPRRGCVGVRSSSPGCFGIRRSLRGCFGVLCRLPGCFGVACRCSVDDSHSHFRSSCSIRCFGVLSRAASLAEVASGLLTCLELAVLRPVLPSGSPEPQLQPACVPTGRPQRTAAAAAAVGIGCFGVLSSAPSAAGPRSLLCRLPPRLQLTFVREGKRKKENQCASCGTCAYSVLSCPLLSLFLSLTHSLCLSLSLPRSLYLSVSFPTSLSLSPSLLVSLSPSLPCSIAPSFSLFTVPYSTVLYPALQTEDQPKETKLLACCLLF